MVPWKYNMRNNKSSMVEKINVLRTSFSTRYEDVMDIRVPNLAVAIA